MLDIWLIDGLLVGAMAYLPFSMVNRFRPCVREGEGVHLHELGENESSYERRRRFRMGQWVAYIALAFYLILRAAFFPPAPAPWSEALHLGFAAVGAFAVSLLLATYLRFGKEKAFLEKHPAFSDSLQPLASRMAGLTLGLLGMSVVISTFAVQDLTTVLIMLLAGILLIRTARVLQNKLMLRNQVLVPPDSPLGVRMAKTVRSFGFTPKACILIPSLTANAYAFADGTVALTTALRTLSTDDEIAAVISHELSHTRDRDARRMQRHKFVGLMTAVALSAGAGRMMPSPSLAFPMAVSALGSLIPISNWWMAGLTQRLEFKCDRDVVIVGLGPDLKSVLTKISLYSGLPGSWRGMDRRLLTHPSLDDRLKAIDDKASAA